MAWGRISERQIHPVLRTACVGSLLLFPGEVELLFRGCLHVNTASRWDLNSLIMLNRPVSQYPWEKNR